MNQRKLKLGILLDSYDMPAWVYRSLERIVNSNCAEISLLIFNEDTHIDNGSRKVRKDKRTILFKTIQCSR